MLKQQKKKSNITEMRENIVLSLMTLVFEISEIIFLLINLTILIDVHNVICV